MAKVAPVKDTLALRLYVAGNAPNSRIAIANLKALCNEHFAAGHEIEIVDLFKHPRRALEDGIIATPTLLKLRPAPVQRVIGNLSNTALLLSALGNK